MVAGSIEEHLPSIDFIALDNLVCQSDKIQKKVSIGNTTAYVKKDNKTIEQDIADLKSFIYNSFINVEMAFQEKLKLPYNVFGKPKDRPDFEKNARNLSDQLIEAGYYR